MKKNPGWRSDKKVLHRLQDRAGADMHKRVSTAWRLYHSPELRAEFAKENGGRPLPDSQVRGLLEDKYFRDCEKMLRPLKTLFAIFQTFPSATMWDVDWPDLLAKVPRAAKAPASKPRQTATVAQMAALNEEYDAFKEQMAAELKKKDAEISVLRADLAKARRRVTTLEKQVENLTNQAAGKRSRKAS